MVRQKPKAGFGKRASNKSVSELIKNHLITLGLNKMAEPVRLLTKWLTDQPSERVTVVSSERLTAERAAKLLSEVGVESKVIDPKNRLSDEAAFVLTIPPLCERLEDLPLLSEYFIAEYLEINEREDRGIHSSHLPVLFFMCYKYNSPTGLITPLLAEDEYVGYLRKALRENLFIRNAKEVVQYSYQLGENEKRKAFRPFTLLRSNYIEFYPDRLPNASLYQKEDNEIASYPIAPIIDPDTGRKLPYQAHVWSVASAEFRHFLDNSGIPKIDRNVLKLVGIDSLQSRMIDNGVKCIPQLAKLKIKPISNISNRHRKAKTFWEMYSVQNDNLVKGVSKQTTVNVIGAGPQNLETVVLTNDKIENRLNKSGDYWEIFFNGKKFMMHNSLGINLISQLLSHPGQSIHVTKLFAIIDGSDFVPIRHNLEQLSDEQLYEIGLSRSKLDNPHDIVDEKALQNIKKQKSETEERLEANYYTEPDKRLEDSQLLDCLNRYLGAVQNIGGRSRKTANSVERTRIRAKSAITRTLVKIQSSHVELWKHLNSTIRTGTTCAYLPDKPTDWCIKIPSQ